MKKKENYWAVTYLLLNEERQIIGEVDEIFTDDPEYNYRTVIKHPVKGEYYKYFKDLDSAKKYVEEKHDPNINWDYVVTIFNKRKK